MPRILSTKVILWLGFLLLLDWSFLPPFKSGFFQPVLLYLMILYTAFEWHWRHALRFAFAIGFLRDVLSTQPLGVETTVLFAVTLALCFFVQKIERRSVIMRGLVGFIFIFAVSLFVLVLSNLLGFAGHALWQCFAIAASMAFSTVLFLPVFFYAAGRWFGEKVFLKQFELFK